ncbi:hypothetical protein F5883DRAFT_551989 [Diaporthe sp. PMI_573]|nr:hypothetical protein F5883DRAFT_551989 [Diaporthaceae sp. PMI_573]
MTISSPILFIRPFMCHVLPACLPLPVSLQGQDLPRGRRNGDGKRNDGIRGRTRSCLGCVGHLAPVRRKHKSPILLRARLNLSWPSAPTGCM